MKEPQRDTTKRQRSTKQKQESFDIPDSEKERVEQSRGADRPSVSTTTGSSVSGQSLTPPTKTKSSPAKPMPQAYPSTETQPSTGKPAGSQEAGKSEGADRATPEASAPASPRHVRHERIAQRAYALYAASGYTGDAIQHWLEAERELRDQNDDGEHEKGA